ncbi:hypothetical protein QOT17_015728 [Balamuthia mandrillaris]
MENKEEEKTCLICLEAPGNPVHLSCACKTHFCLPCIIGWLQAGMTCPTCRQLVSVPGKAKELHEQGVDLLAKAQASGFEDKQSLKDASTAFINGLVCDRNAPECYVGLAYLLLLLDDRPFALRYLNECLRVCPDYEDAKKLKAYALEGLTEQQRQEMMGEEQKQDEPGNNTSGGVAKCSDDGGRKQ